MTTPDNNGTEVVQGQETAPVTQDPVTDTQTSGTDESGSSNDLYAPYLEPFPESLRPMATEVFKKWDGDVTKRFQAQAEQYEPYKPIFDEYEPSGLQQAVQLAEALEANPQQFVQAIVQHFGLDFVQQAQGQEFVNTPVTEPEVQYGDPNLPPEVQERLSQQEQLLRVVAERLVEQDQQREQQALIQQQDEEYEQTMTRLKTSHGEFDEVYVNSLLAQGIDPDLAVNHWKSQVQAFATKQLTPNANAPVVMGAGGGMPSVQRDVSELSSKETRQLVEQMLKAAAEQGN